MNPWGLYPHPSWKRPCTPEWRVALTRADVWHCPWLCSQWAGARTLPLLIWDPASPKGWPRASSFPIPGYEGHRHGQLELKTAPLAHGRSNHGRALFSVWSPGGALGKDDQTLCTACFCGLKIIKLFFSCTARNSFLESISVHWEPVGWCIVMVWHGWKYSCGTGYIMMCKYASECSLHGAETWLSSKRHHQTEIFWRYNLVGFKDLSINFRIWLYDAPGDFISFLNCFQALSLIVIVFSRLNYITLITDYLGASSPHPPQGKSLFEQIQHVKMKVKLNGTTFIRT